MYEVCIFQHNFYTVYLQWNIVWNEQLRTSDSMACIVTILRVGKYEIQTLAGTKIFFFQNIHTGSGPIQAAIQWVMGTPFPGSTAARTWGLPLTVN